jgi:phosphonoacetaldehyde hydrolase
MAIVGPGVIGLAHAYLAAKSGLKIVVFERDPAAAAASIRNFGMIWPIGQPAGHHCHQRRRHDAFIRAGRADSGTDGSYLLMLLNRNVPPHTVSALKLRAVIFDWAGTTVDFGSLAPTRTLQKVFEQFGVPLYESEARRDMGLPKRNHIARILSIERVQAAWKVSHGSGPLEADIDCVYERFVPLQCDCLSEYSTVIDGVPEAVERIRSRDLRVGSTTGCTRPMLDLVVSRSARERSVLDVSLSPEDVGASRPHPFMIFENAVRLQVYPLAGIVKVEDTAADIQEGLNAGAWSVGVAKTGNMISLSKTDLDALPEEGLNIRLRSDRTELERAGAHYVIDTMDELEGVLDDIDIRLRSAALRK